MNKFITKDIFLTVRFKINNQSLITQQQLLVLFESEVTCGSVSESDINSVTAPNDLVSHLIDSKLFQIT